MPKFCITGFMKVRDVVEADDIDMAEKRFRAKYPAFLDKESTIKSIDVVVLKTKENGNGQRHAEKNGRAS